MISELNAKINVTVEVHYLKQESNPIANSYAYAYQVTINNNSGRWCQLLNRHWIITDAEGRTEEVQGEGVVGEQPELDSGEIFRYSSYAMIETPIGSMHGIMSFRMKKVAGSLCRSPLFLYLKQPYCIRRGDWQLTR